MDFSKAVDMVLYSRLVCEVRLHGIQGELANWIQNWPGGKNQRIVVESCFSDSKLEINGVPEETMLGQLPLVIYISFADVKLGNIISKFVADIKIGGTVDSKERYLSL